VEKRRIELSGFNFLRRKRAVADAAVVFPTPPLPPKKRYRFTLDANVATRLSDYVGRRLFPGVETPG